MFIVKKYIEKVRIKTTKIKQGERKESWRERESQTIKNHLILFNLQIKRKELKIELVQDLKLDSKVDLIEKQKEEEEENERCV